jgi:hypothetical protein
MKSRSAFFTIRLNLESVPLSQKLSMYVLARIPYPCTETHVGTVTVTDHRLRRPTTSRTKDPLLKAFLARSRHHAAAFLLETFVIFFYFFMCYAR